MTYLDFSNIKDEKIKKLSVIFMPDSFFYAIMDDNKNIVHHESFNDIKYSDENISNTILKSINKWKDISSLYALSMNDYSFQCETRDDNMLDILPSTQHKVNFLELIPGQNIYNYFHLSPAQDNLYKSLSSGKSVKIRDLVSLLGMYHGGNTGDILHLHIENSRVYIYAQSNGKLLLYRGFEYNQKEDILYFATAAKRLFQNDAYKTNISGGVVKDSPLSQFLEQYLKDYNFVNETILVSKDGYNTTQSHHYFGHLAALT